MRTTVLGTGIMGSAMAANLVRAGHDVVVWNRTRAAAEAVDGATVADDPASAVTGADAVVTMLVDADTVLDVVTPDVAAAIEGTWLQMTTVGEGIHLLAERAAEAGVTLVDCPVAGTKGPAQDGTLTVLASGPDAGRAAADAVFEVVGSRTVWLGEAIGAASRLKLLLNGVLVHQVAAAAEVVEAARVLGLDPSRVLDVVDGGPLGSPAMVGKGRMMVEGVYDTSFPLEHAGKDARLLAEAAEAHGLVLPVTRAIVGLHDAAEAAGAGEEDMAAVIRGLRVHRG